jgi:hypothetical protein
LRMAELNCCSTNERGGGGGGRADSAAAVSSDGLVRGAGDAAAAAYASGRRMKGRLRKAEGLRGCGPSTAPLQRTKSEFMMLPAHHKAEAL